MWAFFIYMLKYFTQSNWTLGLTNIQNDYNIVSFAHILTLEQLNSDFCNPATDLKRESISFALINLGLCVISLIVL